MKKATIWIAISIFLLAVMGQSQSSRRKAQPNRAKAKSSTGATKKKVSRRAVPRKRNVLQTKLNRALELAKAGKYVEASMDLHGLISQPSLASKRMQLRYILGLMLFELKLFQAAAVQFTLVVRDGGSEYVRKSLEKLSLSANALNDSGLLKYAISKVRLSEFPKNNHDMLLFRIGEIQRSKGDPAGAAQSFRKVNEGSEWYIQAKYLEALSLAEMNQLNDSIQVFNRLGSSRTGQKVNDSVRVMALMGKARVFYQAKDWEKAIKYYGEVPLDSPYWHDAVFEGSWAHFRAARFRSVLSQMHTLHSPYYEDHYLPESILLRAFVYLFICQYDEMEITLDFFDNQYQPVLDAMNRFTKMKGAANETAKQLLTLRAKFEEYKEGKKKKDELRLPFSVLRSILKEGDVQNLLRYLDALDQEAQVVNALPATWKNSKIGNWSQKILNERKNKVVQNLGRRGLSHIRRHQSALQTLFQQVEFSRYELVRGKKEQLRKEIAAQGTDTQIDSDNERDFYIQNGYEYWPSDGEYWLDEIGNYHYVGVQSCN
ncbi:MAG: hypothetical protein COT74_06695 [Bdellovibrionales bacterium CG10_big_fil_rev_8_21_14_0_10_45_34]|nr:MAG: hypothetical protein COT74_06695 [Bdellovibrionales bacterium CG10_big_fil_rev_8_21_14_0_10_45_34]